MIKKIVLIVFILVFANSCGKKGNPSIDGKPVENKYFKNK